MKKYFLFLITAFLIMMGVVSFSYAYEYEISFGSPNKQVMEKLFLRVVNEEIKYARHQISFSKGKMVIAEVRMDEETEKRGEVWSGSKFRPFLPIRKYIENVYGDYQIIKVFIDVDKTKLHIFYR